MSDPTAFSATIKIADDALVEYGAEQPTMQLRRVWRNGREYLQQNFLVGFFMDRNGYRVSEKFEWRDVPLEHQ